MSSAADGTGAVAEAYAALGVAVTDSEGNLRDSQEVYWELIDALGQVESDTERDALSMQIFGRSAQDLNSLIAVGSEGMAEYAAQAEDAGAILSGDTLTARFRSRSCEECTRNSPASGPDGSRRRGSRSPGPVYYRNTRS